MKYLAAALLLLTISLSAAAQTETRGTTLYRCGPEGRDLRDAPCPAGVPQKSTELQYDAPSAGQTQAARETSKDTAARASQMARQREQREVRERREAPAATGINGLAGAPQVKPAEPAKTSADKPHKRAKKKATAAAR